MFAQRWYPWFAWRPVRLTSGAFAWLRIIERRNCEDIGGHWNEFREHPSRA